MLQDLLHPPLSPIVLEYTQTSFAIEYYLSYDYTNLEVTMACNEETFGFCYKFYKSSFWYAYDMRNGAVLHKICTSKTADVTILASDVDDSDYFEGRACGIQYVYNSAGMGSQVQVQRNIISEKAFSLVKWLFDEVQDIHAIAEAESRECHRFRVFI